MLAWSRLKCDCEGTMSAELNRETCISILEQFVLDCGSVLLIDPPEGLVLLQRLVVQENGSIRELGPNGFNMAKLAVTRGVLVEERERPPSIQNLEKNFTARFVPSTDLFETLITQAEFVEETGELIFVDPDSSP